MIWRWLVHVMGVDYGLPYGHWGWYNFHSGFGSIILPPLLNGLVLGAIFWWHHQCGVHGCLWYARRTTAANERACFRHHPHPKRTAADIHAAHHHALGLHHGAAGERLYDPGRPDARA
jgi:hypothetical protein